MKFEEIKKKVHDKVEDAKDFYKLHRSSVNGAIAAFVGAAVGTVVITKKLGSKGAGEEVDEEDTAEKWDETYYDRERVFNIDGKEVSGLYQYLGSDGIAIWLDMDDKETRELDKHFREDNEDALNMGNSETQ